MDDHSLINEMISCNPQYASEVHSYNTRYATQQNLYKPHDRKNTGKQIISRYLKNLNVYTFSKNIKHYLLSKKYSK